MAEIKDWSVYPNFTKAEFDCKETGENKMDSEFMEKLQAIRSEFGVPIRITSGYRSPLHTIEKKKASPGAHSSGRAADISINGKAAIQIS
jgi:zinc D-Ala-D-Ala carboxypeptidase